MNKLAIPMTLAAALAAALAIAMATASPALAGPGQCYDANGRPVGPVYDTDYPNHGFSNAVLRRGGSCTGVVSPPSQPNYRYYGPCSGYDDGYNGRGRGSCWNYNPNRSHPTPYHPDPEVFMPDRSR